MNGILVQGAGIARTLTALVRAFEKVHTRDAPSARPLVQIVLETNSLLSSNQEIHKILEAPATLKRKPLSRPRLRFEMWVDVVGGGHRHTPHHTPPAKVRAKHVKSLLSKYLEAEALALNHQP